MRLAEIEIVEATNIKPHKRARKNRYSCVDKTPHSLSAVSGRMNETLAHAKGLGAFVCLPVFRNRFCL